MDKLKKATTRDYTAWDLNAKCVKNNNTLEHQFKRKARRKDKQSLKRLLNVSEDEIWRMQYDD